MACGRKNKISKMKKGTKSVSKYNTGVKQISVPEVTENTQTATTSGIMQGSSVGSSIGSSLGPYGTIAGGLIGGVAGGISSAVKSKEQKEYEMEQQNRALALNTKLQDLQIGNTTYDVNNRIDQFAKGTKSIEIEAKEAPEIHTDKNFNLKNLGNNPHSNGGTKVQAQEGDIIFDTQNSKAKYQSVMNDIRRAKLGDRTAKRRLEQERDSLPDDTTNKMANGVNSVLTNDNSEWDNLYMKPNEYDGVTNYTPDTFNLDNAVSSITGVENQLPTVNNEGPVLIPKGTTTKTSVGSVEPTTITGTTNSDTLNRGSQLLTGIGRFSSPLYKYMKSKENVSTPSEIPLNLQRLQYKDMSDVDRAEVDASRRAIDRQVNTSGLSRGQALGRLSQSAVQAARQKNAINQREQQIRQSIAQQNVNLTNQERQNLQQQQLRNQDVVRRAQGQKEAFLGEAMSDFSKLSNLESQKLYMKNRDKKASEMDQKTLQYLLSNNYRINPETQKLEFISTTKTSK